MAFDPDRRLCDSLPEVKPYEYWKRFRNDFWGVYNASEIVREEIGKLPNGTPAEKQLRLTLYTFRNVWFKGICLMAGGLDEIHEQLTDFHPPAAEIDPEDLYQMLYGYVTENAEIRGTELLNLIMHLLRQKKQG